MLSKINFAHRDATVGRTLRMRRRWFDGEAEEQEAQVNHDDEAQVSDQQNSQPREIDWSAVDPTDLPDEVIKQHPLFQTVLRESIERRKKIRALTEDQPEPKQRQQEQPQEQPQTQVQQSDDMPAWAQQLAEEFQSIRQVIQQSQEVQIQDRREAVIKEYGLPKEAAKFLNGSSVEDITAQAQELAKAFNLPKASAGNAGDQTSVEGLGARALTKLQQNVEPLSAPGIFDAGVQKQHKGGTIR